MSESGTYTYRSEFDFDQLTTESFERCGIFGSDLQGLHIDSARRSLNLLFSEWSAKGPNPWAVDLQTQVLAVGTASYNAPTGTVSILQAFRRQTVGSEVQDTMLSPLSRAEFAALTVKLQSGAPTSYYLDRQITPVIYPWPVADVTGYTFAYYRLRYMQDASKTMTETLDAPQYWLEPLAAGLAAKLSLKWAPDRFDRLDALAIRQWNTASAEDSEGEPLQLQIDASGYEP